MSSLNVSIALTDAVKISVCFSNFLVGLPTHSYILWLLVTRGGAASEIVFGNVCVCEILICLNSLLYGLWVLFPKLFYLVLITEGTSATGRPLFQCLMCVERFLAVVHPVTFLKLKPLRYRIFCCSVAWTIILVSSLFCIISNGTELSYVWFYSSQFCIFFFIQLFCLLSVLRALKQSGPGERKEENHRKRRAFNLILVTSLCMCFSYVPFTVAGFIYAMSDLYIDGLFITAWITNITAGYVQPVFYLQRIGKVSHFCFSKRINT